MIKAVDLRKGKTILHEGELYIVHDAQHVAKGNKRSGHGFVIMDTSTFDQLTADEEIVGDAKNFLIPNEKVNCQFLDGQIISFELPHVVTLEVTDTPPVVKGATVQNQPKDAMLETGVKVRVPAFIEPGEKIRVDTRTGEYIDRAK